jgi:carbon-monoxide dehydrogenase large subunit
MAVMTPTATPGTYIGSSIRRREDPRLITGRATYLNDIVLAGCAQVVFVRSPHAHARIRSIDTSAARAAPDVVAVVTGADLASSMQPVPCIVKFPDMKAPTRRAITSDKARFVGDIVAAVVGSTENAARDAAELVEVDYDVLPAVTDQDAALESGAPLLHDDVPGNIAFTWEIAGGDQSVFETAEVRVPLRMVNQRLVSNFMETRGVLAQWNAPTGELTVWTSTQVPHLVRTELAQVLGVPENTLRVIAPEVGGGFGAKQNFYPEEMIISALAMRLNRPVKLIEERSEHYVATTHGRDHVQDAQVVGKRDGTILGIRVHARANLGAYFSMFAPIVPTGLFGLMLGGPYRMPSVSCRVNGVLTNTTTVDAYRGAGRPEATHLIERLVDMFAAEIGMDPAEVRRRNFPDAEQFPFTSTTGMTYDSGDYNTALDKALEAAGYRQLRAEQAEARARGRLLGIGICSFVEVCGAGPSAALGAAGVGIGFWEAGTVRMMPDGRATVYTGSSAHGQGHETTFAQIAADRLSLPVEDIDVVHGDTAKVPFGIGTFASRSAAVGGTAVAMSATKVRDKGIQIAAHLLEAAPEDLDVEAGEFRVRGAPGRSVTWREVGRNAFLAHRLPAGMEPGLEASTFFDPPNFTWPFGTHVCVTEVDPETGQVKILRYVAVDDCGTVINPMIADGQVHGGITQGLGQALYEGVEYDADGQLLTGSMLDYVVPTSEQAPTYETSHTYTPSPVNPLGVKGIGEAGTIAASAAVVNSVVDALAHLGVRHIDMPLKPERVWRAMQTKGTRL